jgi:molybdate transport system substrate-binding protein
LALSPEAARAGTSVALPASSHSPLRQRMVLLRHAGPEAAGFYAFLQTPAAQAVLAKHGFAPPDVD